LSSGRRAALESEGEHLIRPLKTGDAPGIASLLGELGYPADAAVVERRVPRLPEDGLVLIAEARGAVVGLATAYLTQTIYADHPVCVLSALVVSERERGGGWGRRLVRRVEAWAQQAGAYRVTLASGLARLDAHAFYERLGYQNTAHRYSRLLE
jgi:GNAT superfamily N-acetyltransferase